MGNLLSPPPLIIEPLLEDSLDYEEMTLAPPSTMELVSREKGAYSGSLPWPEYVLDSWFSDDLAKHMLKVPIAVVELRKSCSHTRRSVKSDNGFSPVSLRSVHPERQPQDLAIPLG